MCVGDGDGGLGKSGGTPLIAELTNRNQGAMQVGITHDVDRDNDTGGGGDTQDASGDGSRCSAIGIGDDYPVGGGLNVLNQMTVSLSN